MANGKTKTKELKKVAKVKRYTPKRPVTAAKSSASVASKLSEAPSNLPLFFKAPTVLDKTRHAMASLAPMHDMKFARGTNSVMLNAVEFVEAAKSYPIVFTADPEQPLPLAVLGCGEDNYFIHSSGRWRQDHYVPAYVRQYPFIFFRDPTNAKFFLSLDEGAPEYSVKTKRGATPLFDKAGEPSEFTKRALEFCTSFHQHMAVTKTLCRELKQHNLLTPYNFKATLKGKDIQLSGFLMINEKAFNELPPEIFLDFRQKNWLGFIYLALASSSNWTRLLDLARAKL